MDEKYNTSNCHQYEEPPDADRTAVKCSITLDKPGVWKFIEKYERASLQDLGVRTQLECHDESVKLEISGPAEKIETATSKLQSLVAAVKYESIRINKPGVGAVFESREGKMVIRGLEQENSSVIDGEEEEPTDISDESSDDGDTFSMEELLLTDDDPNSSNMKLSSTETDTSAVVDEAEEGHLLCEKGNVALRVYTGSLTMHRADVLVNTPMKGSTGFAKDGAVSKAFLKAGGKEIEQAYLSQSKRDLVSTPAFGGLKSVCKQVYHIKIGFWSDNTEKELQDKLDMCLKQCAVDGYSSIAFPLIGCGHLRYPVTKVAHCFMKAVEKHSEDQPTTRIALVAYDSIFFDDIRKAFRGADSESDDDSESAGVGDMLEAAAGLAVVDALSDNPFEKLISRTLAFKFLVDAVSAIGDKNKVPDGLLLYSKASASLLLHRGNITDHHADVLVNTTRAGKKTFGGVVARAFRRAGGSDLEMEYKSKGEESMVSTGAYGLDKVCKRIYHLRLAQWQPGMETKLERLIAACLKQCLSDGFSSIAFPTIGCGGLDYPANRVARCFLNAIDNLPEKRLQISIVAYESNLYEEFANFFRGSAGQMKEGDWVRIKPGTTKPKFGWGAVDAKSVGRVISSGRDTGNGIVIVNFKADIKWFGAVGELEVVESGGETLKVGDTVQVRPEIATPRYKWGNVTSESVGKVVRMEQDDEGIKVKVQFPERNNWNGLAREMKLLKSTGSPRLLSIGDTVKVKSTVETPKYDWGNVKPNSVGYVVAIELGGKLWVRYPEDPDWIADAEEMEQIVAHAFVVCDGCQQDPLAGPRYKCRQCADFDFCEGCFCKNRTHRHQFNKIAKPGEPPVPVSVKYADVSKDGEHLVQSRHRPKMQKKVTFHVYAQTDQIARKTAQEIHDYLANSLSEDAVEHPDLDVQSTEILRKIRRLNSPRVAILVDTEAGKVTISGVSKDVVRCRKAVDRLLSGCSEDQTPEQKALTELSKNSRPVPKYWSREVRKRAKASVASGDFLMEVDDDTANAVAAITAESFKADVIGFGKDALGLTHTGIKVTRVQRVENLRIWEEYQAKRSAYAGRALTLNFRGVGDVLTKGFELNKFLESKINELYLFHGTTAENKDAIIKQGLDSRVGRSAGMFGQGVYFAESATKSDQYTDPKRDRTGGNHYMFLARVLLGNPYVCTKAYTYTRPPCATCGEPLCKEHAERFDSVIGTHRDVRAKLLFREFIVYLPGLCYPEYLITYVRIADSTSKIKPRPVSTAPTTGDTPASGTGNPPASRTAYQSSQRSNCCQIS